MHEIDFDWTAEHCCICIPRRACVERFVTCAPPPPPQEPPPSTPCPPPRAHRPCGQDLEDIAELLSSNALDEGLADYAVPDAVMDRLTKLRTAVAEHEAGLGAFGRYAQALGLPAAEPHPQRAALEARLRAVAYSFTVLHTKWGAVAEWRAYYAALQDTPVVDLYASVRRDVAPFAARAEELRRAYADDCVVHKMWADVEWVKGKIDAVEALGHPDMTVRLAVVRGGDGCCGPVGSGLGGGGGGLQSVLSSRPRVEWGVQRGRGATAAA